MEQTNFPQSDQSYHPKHHIKVYVWIGLVVVSLGVAANGYFYFLNLEQGATPVACTMEAKLCPDGTAVGRTGPSCEFAECPGEADSSTSSGQVPSDWKTYRNEEYGFEFRYPENLVFKETFQDTFDNEKWLTVKFYNPNNEASNFALELNIPAVGLWEGCDEEKTEMKSINSLNFERRVYCEENLAYILRSDDYFLFIDWNFDNNTFDQILSTFRFIDTQGTGTLSGKVSIGPNCPVEREGVVCTPSPEAYASREFIVLDSNQKEITRFHADASGNYSLTLSPGTYTVVSAKTGMGYMSKDLPNTINIKAGQSTILNINIDTGIR